MLENDNNIEVLGARVHNLKNIDVKIPREKLVVITGLSGNLVWQFAGIIRHNVLFWHELLAPKY